MTLPKTAKGYIAMMKKIEALHLWNLKGFDKLTSKEQDKLILIGAEISNQLNTD